MLLIVLKAHHYKKLLKYIQCSDWYFKSDFRFQKFKLLNTLDLPCILENPPVEEKKYT